MRKNIIFILFIVILCSSCKKNEIEGNDLKNQIDTLKGEIEILKNKLELKNKDSEILEKKISTKINQIEGNMNKNEYAFIVVEHSNFDVCKNVYGSFLISIDKIESYLDGQKIRLKIGNISNSDFQNAKLNVIYGNIVDFQNAKDNIKEYIESKKNLEFSNTFSNSIRKGVWNKVEFVIRDLPVKDLYFLLVKVEFTTVLLRN